jgi:DNA topoisomerase I
MKTLVIVESPGKLKKLRSILGDGYTVTASVGHVRDLPEKEIGVSPPDFRPTYLPTERGKGVLADLRAAVDGAGRVLLATDPDREGEAIAWHLADALRLQNPQRITFTEITETAVRSAVASPRQINTNLVRAQEARRVLDRAFGYRVSPALTKRASQSLTAGRVQSPAVILVVDRERAIRDFKPTDHYGVELSFSGGWTATWNTEPHLAPGEDYLLDRTLAAQVAAIPHAEVTAFEDGFANRAPAAPFITATLQQAAFFRLRMKPGQLMALAQRLNEQGAISYHRTDSPNLSVEAMDDIARYAAKAGLPLASKRRKWKAKESAQEGHEAIRPTYVDVADAGENEDERALYRLIRDRAIASQLADARFAVRSATLAAKVAGVPVSFLARGRTLIDPGWTVVYGDDTEDEAEAAQASNPVPQLNVGASCSPTSGRVISKTTKAPARFKLVTLGAELERLGIGRPSTYATILENILTRSYVTEDSKDFLHPTGKAEAIRDALVGTFQFAQLDYTRKLEEDLDRIAIGEAQYLPIVAEAWQQLTSDLQNLGAVTVTNLDAIACPVCNAGELRRIKGGNGFFWGCTRYREGCKASFEDQRGKPALGGKQAISCPTCSEGVLRSRSGANGKFWACSRYPDCRATFPDNRNRPVLDGGNKKQASTRK